MCDCGSISLSLSGSSVLSLSVQSRSRAPLPTHNPFLPRRFTLPQLAPTLRWSYHTTHTTLACPPLCVVVCIFPKSHPLLLALLFLCKGSAVGHACLLHNKAKLLQTPFYSRRLIGNERLWMLSLSASQAQTAFWERIHKDTNAYCSQLYFWHLFHHCDCCFWFGFGPLIKRILSNTCTAECTD